MNTTPYTVLVYSGHSHWSVIIEELTCYFPTESAARAYAATIEKHRPEYYIEVIKED